MDKYASILDLSDIKNKRFIITSDLHGCKPQLLKLLKKCNYDPQKDILVHCGDMVDRGVDSKGVLEIFMNAINTYTIQSNHDYKLLRFLKGNPVKISYHFKDTIKQIENMDKEKLLKFLDNLPYIIKLPDYKGKPFYCVHAGIRYNYPIDKQNTNDCIYIRGIDPSNYFAEEKGIWYDFIEDNIYIASGHIGSKTLHPSNTPNVFCLDASCVFGVKLRAIIFDNGNIDMIEINGPKIKPEQLEREYDKRNALVEWGYIRCDKQDDIKIFTYTDKCTYEKYWNDITINSRGHIFNQHTDECVAQAMPKFFNIGQLKETFEKNLPWHLPHEIHEKLDGWLGVHYRHKGEHKIATRGSFHSDGAVWATEYLNQHHNLTDLPNELTLIFEIISPVTKIIVNYQYVGLVLLTAYNRFTQKELSTNEINKIATKYKFKRPIVYTKAKNENTIDFCKNINKHRNGTEHEGFVIKFSNQLRVKIKSKDYMNMAKIVSKLTPLHIWRLMKFGKIDLSTFESLDNNQKQIIKQTGMMLTKQYDKIKKDIEDTIEIYKSKFLQPKTKKHLCLWLQKINYKYFHECIALFDGKIDRLDKMVKEKIKPKGNKL